MAVHCVPHSGQQEAVRSAAAIQGGVLERARNGSYTFCPFEARTLKNGDVAASAIAEHVFSCNHKVGLSKASVIDAHPHTQKHSMLEPWHIQHHPATLNRGKGTMPELYAAL